jgi:1-acyl-sn-glycerol-3-phosphate acyltransferase
VSTHEIDRALGRLLCAFARALTGARARWLGSAPAATQRVYFANHNSHGDFVLLWASLPADLR